MKKGFTLVELLAVIAILGLIVIMTVPIVRENLEKQRFEQFKVSVEGLIKAVNEDIALENYSLPRRYEYKAIDEKKDLYLIESPNPIALQVSGVIKYNAKAVIIITESNDTIVYVENDKYCAVKRSIDSDIMYAKKVIDEELETTSWITEDDVDITDILNEMKTI